MKTPERSRHIEDWADEWHGDLVDFLARRMASRADAQDLAQEVYLRLLRVERPDLVRKPRSYLLRIGANLLHEWRLKARQARPHSSAELEDLISESDPEAQAIRERRATILADEVQKLSASARAALALHSRDALTYEEIAVQMGATPRMVKRWLLEAYARLRASLPQDM